MAIIEMDDSAREMQANLKLHIIKLIEDDNLVVTSMDYADLDATNPDFGQVTIKYINRTEPEAAQ